MKTKTRESVLFGFAMAFFVFIGVGIGFRWFWQGVIIYAAITMFVPPDVESINITVIGAFSLMLATDALTVFFQKQRIRNKVVYCAASLVDLFWIITSGRALYYILVGAEATNIERSTIFWIAIWSIVYSLFASAIKFPSDLLMCFEKIRNKISRITVLKTAT